MKRQKIRNLHIFHDYYSRLKNIAMSVFKWEGLPESCNERFLEDSLFHYGQAAFVNDLEMGYLNLRITPAAALNVYNEPMAFTAYSTNYTKSYLADEIVWIKNNYLCKSTESTLIFYAEKLTLLDLAIQTNTHAQRTPLLIKCDKKTELSLRKLYEQYEGDLPVIFGDKDMLGNPLEAIKTDAPFLIDKLREEKRAVWNEALEFMGINTNPADKKKERLIVTEVNSNNEQIDIQVLTMLLCRQKACEEINKKYGLNVSVSLRVDEMKEEPEAMKEGVLHG